MMTLGPWLGQMQIVAWNPDKSKQKSRGILSGMIENTHRTEFEQYDSGQLTMVTVVSLVLTRAVNDQRQEEPSTSGGIYLTSNPCQTVCSSHSCPCSDLVTVSC